MLALKRLERSAVKVARSVLMGRDHSNVVSLPTNVERLNQLTAQKVLLLEQTYLWLINTTLD